MRVVGGSFRGRRLHAPAGAEVRPTSERSREALFDILGHGADYHTAAGPLPTGARVVDAFAGTGALGLEALSRGAAHVAFIENDPAAIAVLRRNIDALDAAGQVTVLARDATRPGPAPAPCTLALMDPPYGSDLAVPALEALAAADWLAPGAVAVLEVPAKRPFAPPAGFELLDQRKYGRARIVFLRWSGEVDQTAL